MLTGLILGKTLNTKSEEMFKALIEATAFGCLKIINQIDMSIRMSKLKTRSGV